MCCIEGQQTVLLGESSRLTTEYRIRHSGRVKQAD